MFPKKGGTPKWMVKIMEKPIKMDDLGGTPIFGNTHLSSGAGFQPSTEVVPGCSCSDC